MDLFIQQMRDAFLALSQCFAEQLPGPLLGKSSYLVLGPLKDGLF